MAVELRGERRRADASKFVGESSDLPASLGFHTLSLAKISNVAVAHQSLPYIRNAVFVLLPSPSFMLVQGA